MSDSRITNICFFSGDITNSGGTERVGTIIANELSDMDDIYKVSFVSLVEKKDKPFFEINDNIERFALYDEPVRGLTHIVQICHRLRKVVKDNNIDILIDIDGILDMYSLIVKRFTKVKVISWEHFNFYQHPTVGHRKYTRRLAGRYADAIVTLTKSDVSYYKENINIRCPITYIHNPVMSLSEEHVYNADSKIILSVGRLTDQKGFDMLVDVAKEIFKEDNEWKWIILGEGEDRPVLEEKIRKYNLQDKVILKGNVSNVNDYYKETGIFVLTSRYEGLPMTLLETKPFKLPAVSFDIKTGPNECIINDENGFLIEPFNIKDMSEKIKLLMKDKDLRQNFSDNALVDTEKFDLRSIMHKWNEILKSI